MANIGAFSTACSSCISSSPHALASPAQLLRPQLPRSSFNERFKPPTLPSRGRPAVQPVRAQNDRSRGGGALKNAKRAAEGPSYGNSDGGGSPTAYALQAIVSAGLSGLFLLAPNQATNLLFGHDASFIQVVLSKIAGLGWLSVAIANWSQQAAAKAGVLDDDVHRRTDASLSFFAAANLFITSITFVPNPNLYPNSPLQPKTAAALSIVALAQWWISGRNYAKYAPEGANPVAIIKSYLRDVRDTANVNGLNSAIYSALTLAFVAAGFAYIFAPGQTLDLLFNGVPKTPENLYLWQLIGAAVATVVAPICYTQKEAAVNNDFSRPDKRTLNTALASVSVGHVLLLAPLLGTEWSGPAMPLLLGNWGLAAVASALITVKPKE